MDPHYDCRPCCKDESACSIPQCDTGLIAPGCNGEQRPATPRSVQHDVLDVRTEPSYIAPRTQRPSYRNNVDTATTSNGANRQFYPDRQTDRTQRPSYENNVDTATTSNGGLCEACKEAVNKIRRAEMIIVDEQVSRPAEFQ